MMGAMATIKYRNQENELAANDEEVGDSVTARPDLEPCYSFQR